MKACEMSVFFRAGMVSVGLVLGSLLAAPAGGQVVINEILAINREALYPVANDPDYTPAYVELYNNSDVQVDLGNLNGGAWSVSNSTNNQAEFKFPAGTIIPARGYLLLYLDSAVGVTSPPGVHTGDNTNVRDNGDDFVLWNASTNLVDRLEFGMQLIDLSLSRVTDGTGAFALMPPTPLAGNGTQVPVVTISSMNLRINEWVSDGSPDWFEIFNPEAEIVNLEGISFRDNVVPAVPRRLPPHSYLEPGGFLDFVADDLDGGDAANQYEHVAFKLGKSGDEVWMLSPTLAVIDYVWTGVLNGNQSGGRLPDGSTNIVQPLLIVTREASNFQLITNVVINEVLPHTDPPFEDAIELHNPTASPADIGNWWLSNSKADVQKYRIPAGTIIPAGGYKVFYEYVGGPAGAGFNTDGTGTDRMFTLNSARGDEVYLHTADAAGNLTGSRLGQSFGASENGVSFGRYTNSLGDVDFVGLSQRSFGADNPATITAFRQGTGLPNAYPKVGPLVVNEVMYHPPDIIGVGVTNDDSLNEYVEVYNANPTTVPLYDPVMYGYADGRTNTWRLRGEVDFDFPQNVSLAPGGYLLLVNFNPANAVDLNAFRTKYSVPAGTPIYGPYSGKLSNSGGSVELQKPDAPQAPDRPDAGLVPYLRVDRVKYKDSAPWPTGADGDGLAMQRIRPEGYADDPINWKDAPPTPGRHEPLEITSAEQQGGNVVFSFPGTSYSSYTVQYKSSLAPGSSWLKLLDLPALGSSGARWVTNSVAGGTARFYRVVSPTQP